MMTSHNSLRRASQRKPLAVGVAAMLALSSGAALHATPLTWVVKDCADGTNAGQLRWAANGAVSGDTIDLATALAPAGYPNCTNTPTNGFNHVLTVNSAVTLAGGVTIKGPGKNELAISAASVDRVFTANGDLTISDLGVKYGLGWSASGTQSGGCIWAHDNVTLTNVEMLRCSTYSNSGPARGGAVYSYLGSVDMTNSKVTHSSATSVNGVVRGGSVYGYTNVTLKDSVISYSAASTQSSNAEGGAVFSYGKKIGGGGLSLVNSAVSGGTASTDGAGHAWGGATASMGSTYVSYSNVVHGTATTQGIGNAKGGDIYSSGNTSIVNFSQVYTGKAYSKGGVSSGGGIYTKGAALVQDSAISTNSARNGGGVYSGDGFTMKYSSVVGNSASYYGGGVVNNPAGDSFVRGSVIRDNKAYAVGGMYLSAGGGTSITIENTTITGNQASNYGGAIFLIAHHTTLDNSTIAYNTGKSDAVYVAGGAAGSSFDMHSTLIASNAAGSQQRDLFVNASSPFTASSSNNLVRSPSTGVPGDTIVGRCPYLHPIKFDFQRGVGPFNRWILRPSMNSPAIDAGSNPLSLGSDQRGGSASATTPPRASGPGPKNASPIPDIGAYEVDQDDVVFDGTFDGCS